MNSVRIKVSVSEFEWMRNTIRSIVGCGTISDDVYDSWRWEMLFGLHLRMSRVSVVRKKSVSFRLNIPECVAMNGLLGIGGHPYGVAVEYGIEEQLRKQAESYVAKINEFKRQFCY